MSVEHLEYVQKILDETYSDFFKDPAVNCLKSVGSFHLGRSPHGHGRGWAKRRNKAAVGNERPGAKRRLYGRERVATIAPPITGQLLQRVT